MTLAMLAAVLAVFTFGIVMVIPGSIKLRLVERVRMDDAQMGKVLIIWQVTTLVCTLIVGPLLDKFGHKLVMICGFLMVAVAIWCFARATSVPGVFVAAALLGVGGSCANMAGNTLLPALNPTNPAAASNMGNVFFGLGAFLVPFLISRLFQRVSFTAAVSVFGFIAAAAAIPAFLAHYPAVSSGYRLSTAVALLGNGAVLVGGSILFCMVGLEVSAASWTTTYLRKIGFDERKAALLFSLLWVSKIVGRFIASQVVTTGIAKGTILLAALGAAALLLTLTITMNRAVAGVCVASLGLFFGPILPTTVGVTFAKFSPALYGSIFGIIYAVGLVGSSVVPGLVGHYSKTRSIHVGYRLMFVLAALLFLFALLL